MKVKVKDSVPDEFYAFFGNPGEAATRKYKGDVFELKGGKDSKGNVIKPEDQFSSEWMEEIEEEKKKPGRPASNDK